LLLNKTYPIKPNTARAHEESAPINGDSKVNLCKFWLEKLTTVTTGMPTPFAIGMSVGTGFTAIILAIFLECAIGRNFALTGFTGTFGNSHVFSFERF
jgi:hypothetical protein